MKLFVSYSRADVNATESLVRGLKAVGHEVWLDQELSGGVEWWHAILERILAADAFVAVVSRAHLTSVACSREREYAVALAKPVLPVLVESLPPQLLPPDLAQRQLVEYITPNETAAFRLVRGIALLPPAPPIPYPPPQRPEVPMSYLSDISRLVYEHELSRSQQLTIASQLREAAENPEDYEAVQELVALLGRRDDLYAVTQRQLQDILASPRPPVSTILSKGGDAASIAIDSGTVRTARTLNPTANQKRTDDERQRLGSTVKTPGVGDADELAGQSPKLVTAQSVAGQKFQATRFREGYNQDQVDNFLDLVEATLSSLETSTSDGSLLRPDDVTEVRFQATTSFQAGYDQTQVDEFLDRVVETLNWYRNAGDSY